MISKPIVSCFPDILACVIDIYPFCLRSTGFSMSKRKKNLPFRPDVLFQITMFGL